MRLDHLLSREEVEKMCFTVELSRQKEVVLLRRISSKIPRQVNNASGVDALVGNTRSHPDHDG